MQMSRAHAQPAQPSPAQFQLFIAAAASPLKNGGIQERGGGEGEVQYAKINLCLVSCAREAKSKHFTSYTHSHSRTYVCVCVYCIERRETKFSTSNSIVRSFVRSVQSAKAAPGELIPLIARGRSTGAKGLCTRFRSPSFPIYISPQAD